ncbi:MAG: sugar phosphate isomerase/epimerase [Anaerolineae bacterium]|nr:sugar phosphate isomerase/epimerase [Anaerolineae bacterium]
MKEILTDCLWKREQLSEAFEPLARATGLRGLKTSLNESIKSWEKNLNFEEWIEANLSKLGLEADPINISYAEVEALLRDVAPANIPVEHLVDKERRLPGTTGVIDISGFLQALNKIGYCGPVSPEPRDVSLKNYSPETVCELAHKNVTEVFFAAGIMFE